MRVDALSTITLTRLVEAGKLDRVARGLYGLHGAAMGEHRSLAEVALRAPKGVVCLLSALRFHEIGTQAPFEVWVAVPRQQDGFVNSGGPTPATT
jgi:predicted transcriptional regulator of viral defense system